MFVRIGVKPALWTVLLVAAASIGCSYRDRSAVAYLTGEGALFVAIHGSAVTRQSPALQASNPSLLRLSPAELVVAAVEGGRTLHVHAYDLRRRGWTVNAGLNWMMEGRPALAADRQRRLLVAARGPAKDYWMAVVNLAGPRVSEWTGLQGVFGSDPVLTNCGTGPALVAGLDLSGHLWTRTLSWEQAPRSESTWTARGGGGFQGPLRAVCLAGQPVLAARSANGRVWIWPAARAEWVESEVDIKGELQLTSDRKGVWIAGRTAADGIRVCRGTMAGEVPAVGCVALPARVSEFALCPLDEGVRIAAVFPDGELRWWDWPDTDWQRPLLRPIQAVSLDQEVVAGVMGESVR